jgi:hypothetical protein
MTGIGPSRRCEPPAVAAGYWGAPVAGRGAAEPSMAATPRSRRLSEQVPPRRLQELVALDDPLRTPSVHRSGSESVVGHRNVAGLLAWRLVSEAPSSRHPLAPVGTLVLAYAALCS